MLFYRVLELGIGHAPVRYRDIVVDAKPKQVRPTPPSLDWPRADHPWRFPDQLSPVRWIAKSALSPAGRDLGGLLVRVRAGVIPRLGHEQAPIQRTRRLVSGRMNTDGDLAVADFARSARILPGNTGRGTAVFLNPVSSTTHASGSIS